MRNTYEDLSTISDRTGAEHPWRKVVSPAAYELIVRCETGGRPYYERVLKGKPVWPEYSSGITIGCGYDLGYHTIAEFKRDWSARIQRPLLDRLSAAVGFRTTGAARASKVQRAREFVASFQDIVIPWDVAIQQFEEGKMPGLVAQLENSLPNLERLHPHCYGALLSLVFNRGASFANPGGRFREMAQILHLMNDGTRPALEGIPGQIRAMTRLWGKASGISARRLAEADLFEQGLRESLS